MIKKCALSFAVAYFSSSLMAGERTLIVLVESNANTQWTAPLIRSNDDTDWLIPVNTVPISSLDTIALSLLPKFTAPSGVSYFRLSQLGEYTLNENNNSIRLQFKPDLLTLQTINLAPISRKNTLNPNYSGLVMGFSARARYDENTKLTSSSLDNAFSIGIDRWSLSHSGVFIAPPGEGRYNYRRGDTFVKGYFPETMETLILGDVINESSELGSSSRIAGARLFRDFSSNPGFISSPSYVLSSQVAQPSTLELYVNDQLQYSQQVRAGQVDLQNLYGSTYGSDVEVRFKDELGNTRVIQSTLFGNQSLLRPGLADYSFSAGAMRLDENEYRNLASAGNFRYGLTEQITAGAFFEANDQRYLMFGASAQTASPLGEISVSVAGSQTTLTANSERVSGAVARVSFGRTEPLKDGLLAFRFDAIQGSDYYRMGSSLPSSDLIRTVLSMTKSRYSAAISSNIFERFNSTSLSAGIRLLKPLYLRLSATNFSNNEPLYTVSLAYQPIAYTNASSLSASHFTQDNFEGDLLRLSVLDVPSRLFFDANYSATQNAALGIETQQTDLGIRKSWDYLRGGYRFTDTLIDRSHAIDLSTTIALSAGHFAASAGSMGQNGFILAQAPIGEHVIKIDGKSYETGSDGMRLIPVSPFMNREVQMSSKYYLQDGSSDAFATYPYTSTLFKIGAVLPPFLLKVDGELGKTTKELKLADGRIIKQQSDGLFFMQDLPGPRFTLFFKDEKYVFTLPPITTRLPTVLVNFDKKSVRIASQLRP